MSKIYSAPCENNLPNGQLTSPAARSKTVSMKRRSFLKTAAGAAAFAGLGELGFLAQLRPVSAAEAKLKPEAVRLHPEIEPLVRLLENTSRERVLEEVAARIQRGTSYREVLAALLLAGVRYIQPPPGGFNVYTVPIANSAKLVSP